MRSGTTIIEAPGLSANWLSWHQSTVRDETLITVEMGPGGPYWVRIRTASYVTYEQSFASERSARADYERVVECHEMGRPL